MKELGFEENIGVLIMRASRSIDKTGTLDMVNQHGLSGSQWRIIVALSIKEGMNQKEIADLIFLETPTLVPAIDKMEKVGLVERRADPKDRRNNRIFLTKKSRMLIEPVVDFILEFQKMSTKNVSAKDLEITKEVLRKMAKNADARYEEITKK
jgi:MarR family transcriptional regulator for hemolysin